MNTKPLPDDGGDKDGAGMTNWLSKLVRLEVDRSNSDDLNERISHAIDAERVDGWTPVGAISAWNSWGLYIVFEKQEPTSTSGDSEP